MTKTKKVIYTLTEMNFYFHGYMDSINPGLVLSVGQCSNDQRILMTFIKSHFNVEIETASNFQSAQDFMRSKLYSLVLINRKLDEDYSDGLQLIKILKNNTELKKQPVMLISNFSEYQDEAIKLGAVRGFGKNEYTIPSTVELLNQFLPKKIS